jgi:hypothetical protein
LQEIRAISVNRHGTTYPSLSAEDLKLVKESDRKFTALVRFLVGIYAKRLEISGMSLFLDQEILRYEEALAVWDTKRLAAEFEKSMTEMEEANKSIPSFRELDERLAEAKRAQDRQHRSPVDPASRPTQ